MYRIMLKWRLILSRSKWFKECFRCNSILPLFMFKKNGSKHQRENAKGRCFACKRCTNKLIKT